MLDPHSKADGRIHDGLMSTAACLSLLLPLSSSFFSLRLRESSLLEDQFTFLELHVLFTGVDFLELLLSCRLYFSWLVLFLSSLLCVASTFLATFSVPLPLALG